MVKFFILCVPAPLREHLLQKFLTRRTQRSQREEGGPQIAYLRYGTDYSELNKNLWTPLYSMKLRGKNVVFCAYVYNVIFVSKRRYKRKAVFRSHLFNFLENEKGPQISTDYSELSLMIINSE